MRFDVGDDGFHVREVVAFAAEAGDVGGEFRGIEPVVFRDFVKIGNRGEIGGREGFGEFVLENMTGAVPGRSSWEKQGQFTQRRKLLVRNFNRLIQETKEGAGQTISIQQKLDVMKGNILAAEQALRTLG